MHPAFEELAGVDGEVLRSFAVLTTSAKATMRALHERLPVILEKQDWPTWLGEIEGDAAELMQPAGDDVLQLWPVSRAVNNVRNNRAELLDGLTTPLLLRQVMRPLEPTRRKSVHVHSKGD